MNTLSIVIPATGSQAEIEDTLLSILENRPPHCEILVVHDKSYTDPYDLSDEVRFVEFDVPRTIAKLARPIAYLNEGFTHCRGDIVHTLIPGFSVDEDWCGPALELFEDSNVGSVAPRIVAGKKRFAVKGVGYHSRRGKQIIRNNKQPIVAPLFGTGFFRASCLRFMRGFEVRFGPYADVELGLRLNAAKYQSATCGSRVYRHGPIRIQPVLGYRGGKLRGDLHQQAMHVGMTTTSQGVLGLLSEPFHNGTSAVGALIGRMVGHYGQSPANVLSMSSSSIEHVDNEDRRAA